VPKEEDKEAIICKHEARDASMESERKEEEVPSPFLLSCSMLVNNFSPFPVLSVPAKQVVFEPLIN